MNHPAHGPRSAGAAALGALLLALAAVVAVAPPASAHAALVDSDPADGTSLAQAPESVGFTFNEDISEPAFVVVTAAGERVEQGEVRVDGAEVSVDVAPDAPAGEWTAAYRVVSTDGHPVTGQVAFSVDAPAEPTSEPTTGPTTDPTTGPSSEPSAQAAGGTTEGARTPGVQEGFVARHADHLVLGAVLLAAVAGLLVWSRRRRAG